MPSSRIFPASLFGLERHKSSQIYTMKKELLQYYIEPRYDCVIFASFNLCKQFSSCWQYSWPRSGCTRQAYNLYSTSVVQHVRDRYATCTWQACNMYAIGVNMYATGAQHVRDRRATCTWQACNMYAIGVNMYATGAQHVRDRRATCTR